MSGEEFSVRRSDGLDPGSDSRFDSRYVKSFPVSWEQFHRDSRALAWRLAEGREFSSVIGIARGGLAPAMVAARELGVRVVETICVASYDYGRQSDLQVLKTPRDEFLREGGRGSLIIDDLADTGATALAVRGLMPEAHFAAVYVKPQGREVTDTYVTEVSQDTWIYLPWDMELRFAPPIREGAAG